MLCISKLPLNQPSQTVMVEDLFIIEQGENEREQWVLGVNKPEQSHRNNTLFSAAHCSGYK